MQFSILAFSVSSALLVQTNPTFENKQVAGYPVAKTQLTQVDPLIHRVADDQDDPCNKIPRPSWCVFSVRPDGGLSTPYGNVGKDWAPVLKKFKEDHPDSAGPILKDPSGNAYQLKIK